MQPVRDDVTIRPASEAPKKKRLRRAFFRLSIVLGVVIACSAVLFAFRKPILVETAHLLVVKDPLIQSDYIVVPGGDPNSRPFLAAELYKKGLAPRIIVFEAKSDRLIEAGMAMTEDQIYRKVLESEGVPGDAIERLSGVVDSTEDEARSLNRFLSSKSSARIIIVTSAEHTRRTRWIFRKILSGKPIEIRMAAAQNPWYDETNWWQEDNGAMAIAHEYLKFPYYVYRYYF
jgi:uncharacterized SAM-binding protein YcdF (DUF218 family)